MAEYDIKFFSVNYYVGSDGWQNESNQPHNQAKHWINQQAAQGWELHEFIVHSITHIFVILRRSTPAASS